MFTYPVRNFFTKLRLNNWQQSVPLNNRNFNGLGIFLPLRVSNHLMQVWLTNHKC